MKLLQRLRGRRMVRDVDVAGATATYFGLAYNLYLLAHNVERQEKLIARLRDPAQFRGAYYETLVAAWFVLAGFELTLEVPCPAQSRGREAWRLERGGRC